MRTVTVEDRSWTAEKSSRKDDRRDDVDPIAAALVGYNYARV
jgi:hypothetical protein